ncbi:DUF2062 domain-containing protein [Piscinibacter aquaticus]|uniref:DUF2062 domain-containing protein n=1 Tax=Piscinibacter aquaticus TaxID=392597 RepID=A0A5C6U6E3_9BURK|nr:DUF2062 domain-containing protein [Piscinibacter aquaticus]
MGPALHHPRLWHLNRRGVALGLALGLFFGLLIPIAQIPLAGGAAVLLRANVPMAVASTLVTNPVTFGPVYYAALAHRQCDPGDDGRARPPVAGAPEPTGSWWQRTGSACSRPASRCCSARRSSPPASACSATCSSRWAGASRYCWRAGAVAGATPDAPGAAA